MNSDERFRVDVKYGYCVPKLEVFYKSAAVEMKKTRFRLICDLIKWKLYYLICYIESKRK